MKYTHIIWDFNGTLADDVEISVECVNDTLAKYNKPPTNVKEYLDEIVLPLDEYYGKRLDLRVITMGEIFQSFQKGYAQRLYKLPLMNGARQMLDYCKSNGAKQYIVSSFEQTALDVCVKRLKIEQYFEIISGAGDIYCGSKSARAKKIVDISQGGAVLIGDSISDYQTALEAECDCILICKGHQKREDLLKCKSDGKTCVTVIDSMPQLKEYL